MSLESCVSSVCAQHSGVSDFAKLSRVGKHIYTYIYIYIHIYNLSLIHI